MKRVRLIGMVLAAFAAAPASAQQAASAPASVDYRQEANWLCLPGRADACGKPLATTALNPNGYGSTGQVTPAGEARITCQTAAGEVAETTADTVGCFCLDQVPTGPARLLLHTGRHTVATSWVCLR